jgi:hypothetical protein
MESQSVLIWGVIFGGIGLGFFTYGKKQRAVVPFIVGVALFVIPYVLTNIYMLVLAGIALMMVPYFVRI